MSSQCERLAAIWSGRAGRGRALAQNGDSGSIIGYVLDQGGSPVRGVK
jgi:hypothetical protein